MKAVLCPVCNGIGRLCSGSGTNDITCRGCDGKGWVAVPREASLPRYIYPCPYPNSNPYRSYGPVDSSNPYWEVTYC